MVKEKKRRSGGKEHWIFMKPRVSQEKRIRLTDRYGWDGDLSLKSQQRNFARNVDKKLCNEDTDLVIK